MKLQKGELTDSGNFKLTKKIESLDEFLSVLKNNKSIFARHRMYPTSFIYGWNIRLIERWINNGWFYNTEHIKQKK